VELDGDGKGDVILTAIDWEGFGGDGTTEIASLYGTDLSSVRMRMFGTDGLGFPEPVPNVMGAGTQDLLLLREHEDWSMSATLLDGDWGTAFPGMFGWGASGEYIDLAGDATGDGKEDIVVYDSTYDDWTDEYTETTRVISGSNGQAAWTHTTGESDAYEFLVATAADANGSGTADFALIGEGGDGDEYRLLEGANGADLWARARRVGGYLYYLHPGLLEGQGDDLLESVETDGGTFRTGARRGESGALLWRR
jgi:hypothetical protein